MDRIIEDWQHEVGSRGHGTHRLLDDAAIERIHDRLERQGLQWVPPPSVDIGGRTARWCLSSESTVHEPAENHEGACRECGGDLIYVIPVRVDGTVASADPTPVELIRQLADALGKGVLPAMAKSPKVVWEGLLDEVAALAEVDPERSMWPTVERLRTIIRALTGNDDQAAVVVLGAEIPTPQSVDHPDSFPGDVVLLVSGLRMPGLTEESAWSSMNGLVLDLLPAGGPNKPIHIHVVV